MTDRKQLYKFTDDRCELVQYATPKGPIKKTAAKIPVMFYPDGTLCLPINLFLLTHYNAGVSLKGDRGGTLGTKASNLSLIVRFLFNNRLNINDLTDDNLYKLAAELKDEPSINNPLNPRRQSSQIGIVMRLALYFLLWYQELFLFKKSLIGGRNDNAQITISYKKFIRKGFTVNYIHHQAIPPPSVPIDVKPIAGKLINMLYDAVARSAKSLYVRKRRENILRLLECVGGRRGEVVQITVKDI